MMKRISSAFLFCLLWVCHAGATAPTSFRQPHPLAWMHSLPTGEMPGWSESVWLQFSLSNASIWNAPHTMLDKRNNNTLEYFADYEQVSAILEIGGAIFERVSFSVEVPYAYRGGGFLDSIIDGFHVMLTNRRFNRQFYNQDEYHYEVKTNGTDYYEKQDPLRGISNVKPKLKFWLLQWEGDDPGSCPCGFSISAQAKIPMQDERFAGTTGKPDYYYLAHIGVPMFRSSAMWLTAGFSYLNDNPALKGWPVNKKYQMYELAFDFAFSDTWGLHLLGRAESPFLEREHLTYDDPSTDPNIIARNRASSGWNSLVHWRGTNGLGFRYRPSSSTQFNFIFAEDWGVGTSDDEDNVYSNGAPDANFIIQSNFEF